MEMTKVLFATTNPAKVKRYKEKLAKKGIELITLNDIDVKLDVEETGENAVENARLKARAYYEATKMPTLRMDNALYLC